jgi:hypothetical protein
MTYATITTRVALAVIDVDLAAVTGETDGARTSKRVDQIVAYASIQTWIDVTLVYVNLTLCAGETCVTAHTSVHIATNCTYFTTHCYQPYNYTNYTQSQSSSHKPKPYNYTNYTVPIFITQLLSLPALSVTA